MLRITQFGENFEQQIIFCLLKMSLMHSKAGGQNDPMLVEDGFVCFGLKTGEIVLFHPVVGIGFSKNKGIG